MHLVAGIPKKEIARRLSVDVKTVRRALCREDPPLQRRSPARGCLLDAHRERIEDWLRGEPRITSKRIWKLLQPEVAVGRRTVRSFVAEVRERIFRKEAFIRREHLPGETTEFDFGTTLARIGGEFARLKYLVASLPASNAHFAKAYRVERLECLMDGIVEAFRYFGGLTKRAVLDNTALAVREVLPGRERVENKVFAAFRGALPIGVDFCAPRKGWEKGSVEGGVGYVRDNCFRPMADARDLEELNATILRELTEDMDRRRHPDGRTVKEALEEERRHLRPLPAFLPDTCRVLPVVANKFGEIRADRVTYSVPIEHAYRPLIAKLYPDRVLAVMTDEVVAEHERCFVPGKRILDPRHVLRLLERKHRAVPEAAALRGWELPEAFSRLRQELHQRTRKADQEWIRVLRLTEEHPEAAVVAAVEEALDSGSPRLSTVQLLLEKARGQAHSVEPVELSREDLRAIRIDPPRLWSYDSLVEVTR